MSKQKYLDSAILSTFVVGFNWALGLVLFLTGAPWYWPALLALSVIWSTISARKNFRRAFA